MTLDDAITNRLRSASLVGWRMGARVQIVVLAGVATLTLSWVDDRSLHPCAEDNNVNQRFGNRVISIDLTRLPLDVAAEEWSSLPDTEDIIDVPSRSDVVTSAHRLGRATIDRGEMPGKTIWWLR